MDKDVFREVQSIEAEADRIIHEARRTCADIRAELAGKLEELSKQRQNNFATRKPEAKKAVSEKLQTELKDLDKTFKLEKARMEKLQAEQTSALADRVVERFGKEGT